MTPDPAKGPALAKEWAGFMARRDERGKGPTVKEQAHWLAERDGIECELVQVGGKPLDLGREVPKYEDLPGFGTPKCTTHVPDWVLRKVEEDKANKTPIPQEPGWYDAGEALAARVRAVSEAVGLEGVRVELVADAAPADARSRPSAREPAVSGA